MSDNTKDKKSGPKAAFGDECGASDGTHTCTLLVSPPSFLHNLDDIEHKDNYNNKWPGKGRYD